MPTLLKGLALTTKEENWILAKTKMCCSFSFQITFINFQMKKLKLKGINSLLSQNIKLGVYNFQSTNPVFLLCICCFKVI